MFIGFSAVVSASDELTSDDFNSSTLDQSIWTFIDPLGDATLIMTGTQASITVPAGISHDVWTSANNAPRIMQSVSDMDFEIDVKFESQPTSQYQMQGVIVQQDDSNYLRFDFFKDATNTKVFAASFTGGSPTAESTVIISPGNPLYLRVNRQGDQWTQSYSYDGVSWIAAANFNHALTVTSVGPFVGNHGIPEISSPAFTGSIDYFFNTSSPVFPEDEDTFPPNIDLWYGNYQRFGDNGVPQLWVNILGNVHDSSGIASLDYSLNGGNAQPLSIGPDGRRLQSSGDFNVEININDMLCDSDNQVVIRATDYAGNTKNEEVTVHYSCNNVWPETYSINWNDVTSIQDPVQVVDGLWTKEPNSIRPSIIGYDRVVAIGDITWDDYEVTVPITINTPMDSSVIHGPNVGIIMRWQGHYDVDGEQPRSGWWPLGALGVYIWVPQLNDYRLRIIGNNMVLIANDESAKQLEVGVPYMFKMRAQTIGTNTLYSLKVWEQVGDEPSEWTISGYGVPGELKHGSIMLASYYVDASFGDVTIIPEDAGDTTPPAIIDNTPTGTNVPVTTQIHVTFSEAMDQASAESAFLTSPVTGGSFSWNGNIMTYSPDSDLTTDLTYTVTIDTGAMDLADNNMQAEHSWQFTTAVSDTTPPTVTVNEPTGTNVPVTTQIHVTFSEAMDQASAESAFSTSPVTGGSFSWNGNIMTYSPDSDLTPDLTYTVTIDTGAMDLADNNMQAEHSWQFTTEVVPTSINLIQNPGFESGTSLWLFYTSGTGTFSVASPGFEGNNAARFALSSAGKNIQLYQTGVTLEPNTHYRLSFAGYSTTGHDVNVRLFKHVSPYTNYGLDFAANLGTNWQTFTTEFTSSGFTNTVNDGRIQFWLAPFVTSGDTYYIDDIRLEKVDTQDTTPPTVTVNEPTGTNVPVTTQIHVTFSEAMDQASAESAFLTSPVNGGSFSWNGNIMTYSPDSDLTTDLTYTVTIDTGAMDLADNNMQAEHSWEFTTAVLDTKPPTVTVNEPTGTNVPVTTQIHVTFSEAMDQASAESAFSTSPVTGGSFSWNGNIMTYSPDSDLTPDLTYTVTIGTCAMDLAGNNLQTEHSWQFTTEVIPTSINLIQNPGFESGTSLWLFYTSGTGTFSVASPGFEGNNAARLALSSAGTNIQLYQTGVTLEPNTHYRLSFAGYSTTGHDVNVRLFKHVSPYTNYGLDFAANLGTNWQTFTTEFTTTGFIGTVNDGRIQFWLAPFVTSGDTYYIDDIRLEKVDTQDTTPPTVTVNEPTGTNVPVTTQIHVTFSEAMDQASAESAFSTSPVTGGSFSWNGNIMTHSPDSDLTPDLTYTVTIDTGAKDLADNNMEAEHNWQFTTEVVPTSINLIQNPGFESGTSLWLFYTSGTGTFSVASPGFEGNNAARLALSSAGTNIQLYQTGVTLEPNTHYRLSFAGYSTTGHDVNVRLFKHVSPYTNYGLDFAANLGTNWQTFTTEFTTTGFTGTVNDGRIQFWFAPFVTSGDTYYIDDIRLEKIDTQDITLPTVTVKEPTGTNVPVTTQIHVTFSEAMDQASAESAFSTSPVTGGSFSWNGNIMTYSPDSDLTPDLTYTVTIDTGAMDLADNNMQAEHSWEFTTEVSDTTRPTVTGNEPTGTNVPISTQIHVTFSEAMDQASAESAFMTSPVTTGNFIWNGNIMTHSPDSDLTPDLTYTVTIDTGAKDLADNNMEAEHTWEFTTEVEPTSNNLIQNPGFESGTSLWLFYTNGMGTFLNDASGAESPNAGHITISQEGSNVQLYQSGIVLEPNTLYRLSFKSYSNTGHDVSISLHKHGSPYTNYGLLDYVVNLGTSWSEYSTQFTTSGFSGTVNDGRLRFCLSPYDAIGDQYFIDDVILTKV